MPVMEESSDTFWKYNASVFIKEENLSPRQKGTIIECSNDWSLLEMNNISQRTLGQQIKNKDSPHTG